MRRGDTSNSESERSPLRSSSGAHMDLDSDDEQETYIYNTSTAIGATAPILTSNATLITGPGGGGGGGGTSFPTSSSSSNDSQPLRIGPNIPHRHLVSPVQSTSGPWPPPSSNQTLQFPEIYQQQQDPSSFLSPQHFNYYYNNQNQNQNQQQQRNLLAPPPPPLSIPSSGSPSSSSVSVMDPNSHSSRRNGHRRQHRWRQRAGTSNGGPVGESNIKAMMGKDASSLPSSNAVGLAHNPMGRGMAVAVNPNSSDPTATATATATPNGTTAMHNFYPAIRTLSAPDLGPQVQNLQSAHEKDDLKLVKANLRWKTMCGVSVFLNVVLIVLILTSLVYWLVFRDPTIFIDQVQISHIPIADMDLGFNVRFQVDNPSLFNVTVTSCYLSVVIVDPASNVEYEISPAIESTASQSIAGVGTTSFIVSSTISIARNPYFLQISKLVTLGRFGVRLSGHMGYTAVSFGHTAPLSKYQQLYASNIRASLQSQQSQARGIGNQIDQIQLYSNPR